MGFVVDGMHLETLCLLSFLSNLGQLALSLIRLSGQWI